MLCGWQGLAHLTIWQMTRLRSVGRFLAASHLRYNPEMRLMPPFQSSIRSSMPSLFLVLATVLTVAGQSTHYQKVSSRNNRRSAKISEVRAVLAQAMSAALNIRNDFQRGLVLDEIGAAEAKAGFLDTAVVTANRAYPHTMAILEAIGEELGNLNDLPKAQALGRRLKGGSASSLFAFMARRQAE